MFNKRYSFPDWQTNKIGELGTGRIKSSTYDLSIKATTFRKHVVSIRLGYTYSETPTAFLCYISNATEQPMYLH
jgi:hypothetical protein